MSGKNPHNVYHGYDGLSKNPQMSPELREYGAQQKSQMSNEWHGQHGAFHNPSSGAEAKQAAMDKMQPLAPDSFKGQR
ncbi:hypothetical protein JCM10908_005076 [Rhodotorula pacifica]|uniref:uncharacterized protein n=1 Tax=Rhodotorula pacifica TaxID=1495444 RepID=UPI003172DB1A